LDHSWYSVEDSVGFIFDSFLKQEDKLPPLQSVGMEEWNQQIFDDEGYWSFYSWVAIASNNEASDAIATRRSQFVSTGGLLKKAEFICPLCTKEHGRDIGVYERDKEGKFICPHSLPGYGYYDDSEEEEMPYVVVNGNYDPVEISLVVAGNLPNAQVIRFKGEDLANAQSLKSSMEQKSGVAIA
jgi:hypothetical protein